MRSLLLVIALRLASTVAQRATSSSLEGNNTTCNADYQQVDDTGDCVCREGFSGLGCRMCTVNAEQDSPDVCASALGSGYLCVTSFTYDSSSSGKTYTCTLSSDLQALLPDGAIDVSCERENQGNGTCQAAVYLSKETIDSEHMIDCNMTQCSMPTGSVNVDCGAITCKCGSSCSAMTKQLVDGLSNQPAKIQVDESAGMLTLQIEGSPLPLSATCKVSACQLPGTNDGAEAGTASTTSSDDASTDDTGKGLAVVACIALATLLLLGLFSFCCCIGGSRSDQKEENLETELLKVATRSAKKLEFTNLSCFAAPERKSIERKVVLNAISGNVARGQVLGLLGPSGSGKTTLLNALAAMQNGASTFTGELLLDGSPVTKGYRRVAAYVQQDDTLFSTLTVRECITYSAQLRLPLSMTKAAKNAMVNKVITELNLGHIQNSRIGCVGGSTTDRGISGGERRRVSIGMELVTSPQILLLDEPTSGLDSSSAHSVVKLIKELASHDRIVILSIHQPSSRSFLLLDKIMLLAKGQLLYSGPPADSKQHFIDLGFQCPDDDNIADFILDVASDTENLSRIPSHQDNTIPVKIASSVQPQSEPYSPSTPVGSPAYDAPFVIDDSSESRSLPAAFQAMMLELRVLFTRTTQNILRHRSLLVQHVILSVLLGLIGGLIFNNVTDNLAGFQNRMGAFFFILTFFGFASLSSMDLFISERPIFLRETGARYYSAFSYFLAKMTLDALLLRVLPASIFAWIFYWLMALQAKSDRFLLFWLTLVLFNVAAGSISVLVGVLSKRVGSANLAATVVLLIMLLFGGFLLNAETMPKSVGWLQHLSIFSYAFEVLMVNELEGIVLSFDAPGYPAVPVYGEVYLRTLGMEYTQRYYDVAALAVSSIILQILAYFFMSMQVPSNRAIDGYGKKTV
ncbi:atp-binding cassette superfamily [Plasmopara halstedii]|uniref:Atp-binding cassette superfamily n=1 Tax=Plasmopara halstedii TaxID=4781 RepID=A0A0P1AUI6_PLAHL|nr:atp-binding cassette superfamily [Plasmopara halstedii]CEG44556.1 atp-binding cassette superfamily [Plasmopara halstedii]|eukprot:XP_024580925.1 atp-binding cassette superfamily [Plasmopara halstedii]